MLNPQIANYIGLAAGGLTTASYIPQVLRILRQRSAKDISVWMFLALVTGLLLWAVYGVLIHSFPVIITNIISLLLAAAVIVLKKKYG
ncbi:MAG: SemiSWEET transporter [Actinomycetota bacterium]|nr:SemiSWEET transporter [Actinomycetota bacterium]